MSMKFRLDPFYIASYYITWVKTSWTDSIILSTVIINMGEAALPLLGVSCVVTNFHNGKKPFCISVGLQELDIIYRTSGILNTRIK